MFPYSIKKRILKFIKCEFYIVDEFDNVFVSKDEFKYMLLPKHTYDCHVDNLSNIKWYGYNDDEIKKLSGEYRYNESWLIYSYKKRYLLGFYCGKYKLKTDYFEIINILHYDMSDFLDYYDTKKSFKDYYDTLITICEKYPDNSFKLDDRILILINYIKENINYIEKVYGENIINIISYPFLNNTESYLKNVCNCEIFNDIDAFNYYSKYYLNKNVGIDYNYDDDGYHRNGYDKLNYNKFLTYRNDDTANEFFRKKITEKIVNLYDNYNLLKINDNSELNDIDITYIENNEVKIKKNIINNKIKIINKDMFNERLNEYTNNIFEFIKEDEWEKIFFAGGGLFNVLNNCEIKCNDTINNSDIDLFSYDINLVTEILYRIKEKYNDMKVYKSSVYRNYIEVHIPNMRIIQFIFCDNDINENINSVINNFDISCYKVYYDGKNVYCNVECLYCYKYWYCIENIQIMNNKKYYKYINRMIKTMKKGFGMNFISNNRDNLEIIYDNLKIKHYDNNMEEITCDLNLHNILNIACWKYFDRLISESDWHE